MNMPPLTLFGVVVFIGQMMAPTAGAAELPLPKRLVQVASGLLDEAQVSYVYGGYQVGDDDACRRCNECLADKVPKPKQRLKLCSVCAQCSLDCSHFTALVFKEAGAPYPYLDTATMLSLTGEGLTRRYGLVDLGVDLDRAAPGDLLVYDGHVVMLEKRHRPVSAPGVASVAAHRFRGDIVHATGGKDVRGPGEGIQRERFIDLATFRGPLRRILRHRALADASSVISEARATKATPRAARPAPAAPAPTRRLRPVAKRQPNGD